MKPQLYKFQEEGVDFMVRKDGRVLLADEVGLGKTIQTLAYLREHYKEATLPALVVCPGHLRINWLREAIASELGAIVWSPKSTLKAFMAAGVNVTSIESPIWSNITIVSYDTLVDATMERVEVERNGKKKKEWRVRKDHPFQQMRTLVLDEAQAIKEDASGRSKAAFAVALLSKHVIAITGTPIMNRPREIWNIGRTVRRGINWPTFFEFAKRFCGAYQMKIRVRGGREKLVWNFDGASNLEELNERLRKSIMIKRTKSEVELQLPEKMRFTVPLQMGDPKRYAEALESLKTVWTEKKRMKDLLSQFPDHEIKAALARKIEREAKAVKIKLRDKKDSDSEHTVLGEISRLRKEVALAKVPEAVEYIANLAESDSVVVFCHHHEVTDKIYDGLFGLDVNVSQIDGRTDAGMRQKVVDLFQNGEIRVLVLGIMAAGTGLTLTKSATSVIVELPWQPGDLEQATGRVHRIGQARGVTEHILIAAGTIEEKIAKLLDSKRDVAAVATGDMDKVASEESILEAVMNF